MKKRMILGLCMLLCLVGCNHATHWEIEAAQRLCREYGGIETLHSRVGYQYTVTCKTGMYFGEVQMNGMETQVKEEKQHDR